MTLFQLARMNKTMRNLEKRMILILPRLSFFGEEKERDKLIVIDNDSGLADCSYTSASFLTDMRKSCYSCVLNFYLFYPEKANWKLMISQTKMLNLFAAYVNLSSVTSILSVSCTRVTFCQIPKSSLWLDRLPIDLSHKSSSGKILTNLSRVATVLFQYQL